MTTYYHRHPSPVGDLLLVGTAAHLTGLYMSEHRHGPRIDRRWIEDAAPFQAAIAQLDAYFGGRLTSFDLSVAPEGTPFQQRVWNELLRIPHGETVTYGELAARVGAPGAARGVGHAVGRNPISIVVPCHRVVGADGSLTGYAGGLERKRRLLELETTQARSFAAATA